MSSLNWEIIDLPGGSITETNPGVIYSNGVVDWNKDYWGDFQVKVTPVSCDSSTGTPVLSDIFTINERNDQLPLIAPLGGDANLPSCPIPLTGVTTTTLKNFDNFPIEWTVSDLNALRTGGGTNQNTVTHIFQRRLAPDVGTNDTELTLYWDPGFSGTLIVTAKAITCDGAERNYPIIIPGPANIEKVPGTGSANQLICAGSQIDDIEYHLKGAATGVVSAVAMGLPEGVNPVTVSYTHLTLPTILLV